MISRGIVIILLVAIILLAATLIDKYKANGGNPMKRKIWIRTAVIMLIVSVLVTALT